MENPRAEQQEPKHPYRHVDQFSEKRTEYPNNTLNSINEIPFEDTQMISIDAVQQPGRYIQPIPPLAGDPMSQLTVYSKSIAPMIPNDLAQQAQALGLHHIMLNLQQQTDDAVRATEAAVSDQFARLYNRHPAN